MSSIKRNRFLEAHKDKPIENNQSYYYPKNPDDLMKPEKMKK